MSSSSHKKKKTKITSQQSSIPTVDRISDLPDPILCHILNSFPTKFAATTSVLSKRWKELWLSVPALKFDSRGFKTCRLLRLGVHSTLNKRDIIQSFSLKYHKILSCEQKDVNKFVDLILQRGIQNLYLNPSKYACILIALPVTILSCRTLKVLKLTNITVKSIFDVVDLPSIKTLHLKKIIFERYKNLVSLLLSCPILEDLETTSCSIVDIHQVRFMIIPTVLPNLVKARISELEIPLCTVSKAKILCVAELGMFTCCTTQLLMFQNLTRLELHFDHQLWNPRWTWLLGMLEFSPKLQTLIIKDNDVLDEANDECWNLPPPVPECLLSQLKTCRIRNYKGKKYDLEFAKYIIENSKVLDIMTINSACSLVTKAKTRLSKRLSSCTRGSATFKLLFD